MAPETRHKGQQGGKGLLYIHAMQWMNKLPGVSKMLEKAGDKLKAMRRGKDRDDEKEQEPHRVAPKTTEEPEHSPTATQNAIKENKELEQQVEEVKGQLAPVKLKEGEEEIIRPSSTPPNTETDDGSNESYRGRVPWNDSFYQEPDTGVDAGIDDEGIEI